MSRQKGSAKGLQQHAREVRERLGLNRTKVKMWFYNSAMTVDEIRTSQMSIDETMSAPGKLFNNVWDGLQSKCNTYDVNFIIIGKVIWIEDDHSVLKPVAYYVVPMVCDRVTGKRRAFTHRECDALRTLTSYDTLAGVASRYSKGELSEVENSKPNSLTFISEEVFN